MGLDIEILLIGRLFCGSAVRSEKTVSLLHISALTATTFLSGIPRMIGFFEDFGESVEGKETPFIF